MIRLFEMFAGYGGASFALKKVGISFECVGYSEIKKTAIACYNKNHPNIRNFGDCTKIDPNNILDFNLLTAGFPCQTFSMAGNMEGFNDPRGTLFNEIIRIASVKKPTYMLLENVEGLVNHDNGNTLRTIVYEIEKIGYKIIYKVLDSSQHGIPQTRRRIFFICRYEKPWGFNEFRWPIKKPCIKLIDLLEKEVPDKYFLTEKQIQKILNWKSHRNPLNNIKCEGSIGTLTASYANGAEMQIIGENKVRFIDEISPTLVCGICHTHYQTPLINPVRLTGFHKNTVSNTEKMHTLTATDVLGNAQHSPYQGDKIHESNSLMGTIPANGGNNLHGIDLSHAGKIRKLTPRECFRLQGFVNDEIDISMLSDNAAYNLAGDGWEINVVSLLMKEISRLIGISDKKEDEKYEQGQGEEDKRASEGGQDHSSDSGTSGYDQELDKLAQVENEG